MNQVHSYTTFRLPENEGLKRNTAHPVAIPLFLLSRSYSATRMPGLVQPYKPSQPVSLRGYRYDNLHFISLNGKQQRQTCPSPLFLSWSEASRQTATKILENTSQPFIFTINPPSLSTIKNWL